MFDGQPIGHKTPHEVVRLGIAMVPEGRRLFPSLSVEENLLLGGHSERNGPWNLRRVYELFPRLHELRHLPAPALSGGQQQMAAIGRALMSNPRLLLCDELSLGSGAGRHPRHLPMPRRHHRAKAPPSCWSSRTSIARSTLPRASIAFRRAAWRSARRPRISIAPRSRRRISVCEAAHDGMAQHSHPGQPARRHLRAVRHRAVDVVRHHAARQYRPRRLHRALGLCGAGGHPRHRARSVLEPRSSSCR